MEELMNVVDWSRAQFALTAMYHWIFVPLTLGLAIIVAIMESIYVKTNDTKWLGITKFWMLLFGINFAIGVATGIILEFEFGTNWSNYSWFVGDIFGAPLAIEGIFAFFMESTFFAVMFFGWNKVSKRFHLTATWLTAFGASLSALWILVANAWMQFPVGMEFNPDTMRNEMVDFWAVLFSPVAINKFLHTVLSSWVLGSVFVIGVSGWMLLKKRNISMATKSIKVAVWVGLVGILLTLQTGDKSAVIVGEVQPMKLAAMEGSYHGDKGEELVLLGIPNCDKCYNNSEEEFECEIGLPCGLAMLARRDMEAFVPGITDIINGFDINADGDTIYTVSYEERIARGLLAHQALRDYDAAKTANDSLAMSAAQVELAKNFEFFGYGYFESPQEAIPNIPLVFYSFRIMVFLGSYFILFFVVVAFLIYRTEVMQKNRWMQLLTIISIPLVWICSESGWVVAEVGRQPWCIQNLMPNKAAISAIPSASVQITFAIFAVLLTLLFLAEVSIMLRQINKKSLIDIENDNH